MLFLLITINTKIVKNFSIEIVLKAPFSILIIFWFVFIQLIHVNLSQIIV